MWSSAIGCNVTLMLSLLVAPLAAEAQPGGKMPRLGVLTPGIPPQPCLEAFRQELRTLGYVEGQTIALEVRWDEHHPERRPALAADLVRLRVALIVAGTTVAAPADTQVPSIVPHVIAASPDPVHD